MEDAIESDPSSSSGRRKNSSRRSAGPSLNERGIPLPADDDVTALPKTTIDAVPAVPDDLDEKDPRKKTIRVFVNNLARWDGASPNCGTLTALAMARTRSKKPRVPTHATHRQRRHRSWCVHVRVPHCVKIGRTSL
jgi:hypothetical protein